MGLSSAIPTAGNGLEFYRGRLRRSPWARPDSASSSLVIGDYFKAIGTPLIRGRYFTDSDSADSQLVVIVNHEFAEHYWPHQDPIGKRIHIGIEKSRSLDNRRRRSG